MTRQKSATRGAMWDNEGVPISGPGGALTPLALADQHSKEVIDVAIVPCPRPAVIIPANFGRVN